jgi:hypothetical protein
MLFLQAIRFDMQPQVLRTGSGSDILDVSQNASHSRHASEAPPCVISCDALLPFNSCMLARSGEQQSLVDRANV